MSDYVCLDGPLAGAAVGSDDEHVPGELMALEVTDVGQGPDDVVVYEYRVETVAGDWPGELRFVAERAVAAA